MTAAYVDTSYVAAIAFRHRGSERLRARLRRFGRLVSSNLLEAELRSALAREGVTVSPHALLSWITWIYPNRSLTAEYAKDLTFLTLDRPQKQAAAALAFTT